MQELFSFLKIIITSNTFNFILMLLILGWIVMKLNISSILGKGIDNVLQNIKKSDDAKSEAQKQLKSAQRLLEDLPNNIKDIEKTSAQKIQVFEKQINENTKKTIESFEQNIKNVIEIEEKKISNALTEQTAKDSIIQAKEKIINILNANPNLHEKFIQSSIDELDGVNI